MADTVNIQTVFAGTRKHVIHLTNESDGTGESGVTKLDISGLIGPDGTAPTSVSLIEASWDVQSTNGGYVVLEWDHTTDDEMLVLGGSGAVSFEKLGGLHDPKSTGGTGDVLLTTDSFVDGDSYDITLVFKLKD